MSDAYALEVYRSPLPERIGYAKALAASRLLPDAFAGHPENVLIALECGAALGVPPIQALSSINVIKGKPTMSADLMAALVRRAGHKLRVEGDDSRCTATVVRADDPDHPMSAAWDLDKARRAGLMGRNQTWSQYPGAMLRARAVSEVVRAAASEVLMGVIYTPEELASVGDGPVVDVAAEAVPVAVEGESAPPAGEPSGGDVPVEDVSVDASEEQLARIGEFAKHFNLTRTQLARTFEYVLGSYDPQRLSEVEAQKVIDYFVSRQKEAQS